MGSLPPSVESHLRLQLRPHLLHGAAAARSAMAAMPAIAKRPMTANLATPAAT